MSLTYEELFELLRRERNSEDLQTLDRNFYKELVEYFQEKQKVLDDKSEEAEMFASSEKEKVKVQLENAKKIAKEFIERREKKIIILALNKSRTKSDIIDTSALLDVEKEFFHQASKLFDSYRQSVLEKVSNMEYPKFGNEDVSKYKHEEESEEPKTGMNEEKGMTDEIKELENEKNDTETEEEKDRRLEVKFKSSIPKFVGKNEEVYGPYEEEETAELSEEIAQILIKKGRAEEV